jgi:hypothetical protein
MTETLYVLLDDPARGRSVGEQVIGMRGVGDAWLIGTG